MPDEARFEEYLRGLGLAPRTIELALANTRRARARYGDVALLDALSDSCFTAGTRTVTAKALLHWARFLGDTELEAKIKAAWPKGPRRARPVQGLKLRTEWPALIAQVDLLQEDDPRTWATVRLLIFAGLRIAEALDVTGEQLRAVIAEGSAMIRQKAGASRYLSVTEELYEPFSVLAHAVKPDQTIADTLYTRRRRTRSSIEAHIRRTISKVARAAGIRQRVTPHTLRRTLAHGVHVATGGNMIAVRDALGHADVKTTAAWYLDDAEPEELGQNLDKVTELLLPRGGE